MSVLTEDSPARRDPASTAAARSSRRVQNILRVRFLGVLFFLLLVCIAFTVAADRFLTLGNARAVLFSAAILAVAACGQSLVVLTGNLDLSVGSVMGLSAYITASVAAAHNGAGPLLILLAVAIGVGLGLINGVLVAYLEIPSIVATLGTLSVYRGITYLYAHGQQVTSNELPGWMARVIDRPVLGVPSLVVIAVAVVAALGAILRYTTWGRMLYAVGSNADAARFYGLPAKRMTLSAYVAAGGVAALAGFLYAAQVGTITVVLANGWELQVLAAAVIGGVSIWGGSGSVVGVALGAVVLATIDNGLVLLDVPNYWQLLIQGLAIALAVAVDAAVTRQVRRITRTRRRVAVTA